MLVRTYVRRLRMAASLRLLPVPVVPAGFDLVPWEAELVEPHAEVKWLAFRDTLDASIFPNLGRADGCVQLMHAIAGHTGFVPEATWLARGPDGPCGCIQGVRGVRRSGMIQNLAVLSEWRGHGVGRALLEAALWGFREAGLVTAQLEVSARNTPAVRLYQSLGFQVRKTFYRESRAEYTEYSI
jgi:ribosomal protein S18 acetylase RimI-like enzyme